MHFIEFTYIQHKMLLHHQTLQIENRNKICGIIVTDPSIHRAYHIFLVQITVYTGINMEGWVKK